MSIRTQLYNNRKTLREMDMNYPNVWHVVTAVTTIGTGKSWESPFKTLAEAIAVASAGDTIKIWGEVNESGLELAVEVHIIGQNTSRNQNNTLLYPADAEPIFIVKAHQCSIENVGFAQTEAALAIQIGDTAGQAWHKLHIKNCKFDGWGTSTGAIALGDPAIDAPDIHIEKCLFRSFNGDVIVSNMTRGLFEDNIIHVVANFSGISHVPNGGDRPDTIIQNNLIKGVNSGDTGIEIVNTPNPDALVVTGNKVYNCETDITYINTLTGVRDNIYNRDLLIEDTYAYLNAGGVQDIIEITNSQRALVRSIAIDCTELTQNGTIGFWMKIDATNYREVKTTAFTVASEDSVGWIINLVVNADFKITFTEGGDEGADRSLPYVLSYQLLE
jgi:hypothetical protein